MRVLRELLDVYEVTVGDRVVTVVAPRPDAAVTLALAHLGVQWNPLVPCPFGAVLVGDARGLALDGSLADLRACAARVAAAEKARQELMVRCGTEDSALARALEKIAAADALANEVREVVGVMFCKMPTLHDDVSSALGNYDRVAKP